MRDYFRRISYFSTLAWPIAIALLIAFLAVTHPHWPRGWCIAAFLAALIVLPGVLLALKLGSTPIVKEKVVFLWGRAPGIIVVRRENGEEDRFYHREIFAHFVEGKIKEGDLLSLHLLDKDIVSWEKL
ncbi:hypothetical protein [Ammonifex thiophilus]|uniref:Uncharacterized protein n=1 Tax=Ammonifex thiophilus TaxID=444093 RepID=A0A3D8P1I8_9THEO|nr:hypothetical protein [Ammonifex thiophilus]RDV81300.1 hypothetical protein DXX99_09375 [Ammonifex thiophilus]